jgi:TIR domain
LVGSNSRNDPRLHIFVFLLDPKALNSTACQREWGYAKELGKPILPILVADGVSTNTLPPELSQLQYVDYRKKDRNSAFSLARALASVPSSKPLPDPLPPPPEAPVSYLGALAWKIENAAILSYEEQSALLVDLRTSLRDVATTGDARALLESLRKRRDFLRPSRRRLMNCSEATDQRWGSLNQNVPESLIYRLKQDQQLLLLALSWGPSAAAVPVEVCLRARLSERLSDGLSD